MLFPDHQPEPRKLEGGEIEEGLVRNFQAIGLAEKERDVGEAKLGQVLPQNVAFEVDGATEEENVGDKVATEGATIATISVEQLKFFPESVAVIWEVTFNRIENRLSAVATDEAYDCELEPRVNKPYFCQSIRNGLKEIFEKLGFTLTNSRSAYVANTSVYKRALGSTTLEVFVLQNHGRNPDVIRAQRWLQTVLRQQAICSISSPVADPDGRADTTPLLVMECERIL